MEAVFDMILEMSRKVCWIIPVVLAVRLLLRNAPKRYTFALWGVVAFRLVCPVSFSSVFSLFSLKPTAAAPAVRLPQTVTVLPQTPVTAPTVIAPSVAEPVSAAPNYAMLLWLAGAAVMAAVGVITYLRLKRRMATAVRLREPVWQSEQVRSPFILGLFRPRIYVPYGLEPGAMAHVLAHEERHLRNLDHWIRAFAYGLLTVYWFHPLVWLSFVLMSRDMELRCDERVLNGSVDSVAYSETLLAFASNRRFPAPTMLAFGESAVKTRIKHALRWKKPRVWLTAAAVLICVLVIAACAADPKEPVRKQEEQPPVEENANGGTEAEKPPVPITPVTDAEAEFSAPSQWISRSCLYLVPYSSYFPKDGNSGRIYTLGGSSFELTDQNSDSVLQRTPKNDWSWRVLEQDNVLWTWLEDAGVQPTDYAELQFMTLTDEYFLLQADGALCVGRLLGDGLESLYGLQPYGEPARCELYLHTDKQDSWLLDLTRYAGEYDYKHAQAETLQASGDLVVRLQPTWETETLTVLADYYDADGKNDLQTLTLQKQNGGFILPVDHRNVGQEEQLILRVPWEGDEFAVRIQLQAATRDPLVAAEWELRSLEGYAGHEILDHQTVVGCGDKGCDEITTVYALVAMTLEDTDWEVWIPTSMTFYVDDEGCGITEFWQPEEYKDYLPQIREKFPETDLDPEKTALLHSKAVTARVDYLLTLMEVYGGVHTSMNALLADYDAEYEELLSYGDTTLLYLYDQFLDGNETGLKGNVMQRLLDEMNGDPLKLETANGQEYFNAWMAHYRRLADANGEQWVKANYPKAWLLLELLNQTP